MPADSSRFRQRTFSLGGPQPGVDLVKSLQLAAEDEAEHRFGAIASYKGLQATSERASKAARGSSRKRDTRCELVLRRALWRAGLRYRKDVAELAGRPDIVFSAPRVAIFCDGDFWHGKDWAARRRRLAAGANAAYWVSKIERNRRRDREVDATLEAQGWRVLRIWESAIQGDVAAVVRSICDVLEARRQGLDKRRRKA